VRKGAKAELAPAVKSALSAAAARKSALLMFMNLAQSAAAITGRPVAAVQGR
jgi:hypothetical protein